MECFTTVSLLVLSPLYLLPQHTQNTPGMWSNGARESGQIVGNLGWRAWEAEENLPLR